MGLPLDDVFYFGNTVGETGNSFIDGIDFVFVRDNPRNFFNRATLDFRADINRDSLVDGNDLGLVRDHPTNFLTSLKILTPPAHITPDRQPYVPPQLLSSHSAMSANDFSNTALSNSTAGESENLSFADERQNYFAALDSVQVEARAFASEQRWPSNSDVLPAAQQPLSGSYARFYWQQLQWEQHTAVLPQPSATRKLSIRKM